LRIAYRHRYRHLAREQEADAIAGKIRKGADRFPWEPGHGRPFDPIGTVQAAERGNRLGEQPEADTGNPMSGAVGHLAGNVDVLGERVRPGYRQARQDQTVPEPDASRFR
jgi:hypothetical protein